MTLQRRFFSQYYLSRWCRNEGNCDPEQVKNHLQMWIAGFAFFSWLPDLPEQQFGTTLSSFVHDFVGDQALNGINTFVTSAFGPEWIKHFQIIQSIRDTMEFDNKQPHPSNLVQMFIPYPTITQPWVNLTSMPRNITLMTKFLLYSGYMESVSKHYSTSKDDVVKTELGRFPYRLRETYKVRIHVLLLQMYSDF